MLALTHHPSSLLPLCELTHLDRQPIDLELARAQHAAYRLALHAAGVEVRVFDFNRQHADSVFVEDVAVILDELIVLGSMGAKSREPEISAWRKTLSRIRPIQELPDGAKLEGGDVLRIGDTLLIGRSSRTNAAAIDAVAKIVRPFGYVVHSVPVKECLHLKTACTSLDDETMLVNPKWVAASELPNKRLIFAADPWGANIVRLPNCLLANSQYEATIDQLTAEGFTIVAVDLSEFAKAEAGATCLSLLI